MSGHAFTPGDQPKTETAGGVPPDTQPMTPNPAPEEKKARRGFAAMDRAAVRAIARRGGLVAHERGKAHHFTTEEARDAGRKGGLAPHRTRGRQGRPSNGEAKNVDAAPPA